MSRGRVPRANWTVKRFPFRSEPSSLSCILVRLLFEAWIIIDEGDARKAGIKSLVDAVGG